MLSACLGETWEDSKVDFRERGRGGLLGNERPNFGEGRNLHERGMPRGGQRGVLAGLGQDRGWAQETGDPLQYFTGPL